MEEEELRGWRGGKRRKEMRGEKRRGRGREKEGEERGDTESGKTTMAYCGDGKWAEEGEGGRRKGEGEVVKWSVGGGEKGRRGEGDEEGREDEESEERREGRGRREGGVRKRREAQGLKEKRRGE